MYYSQKDYPNVKLGTCADTIAQSGCFLTSFCNVLQELKVAMITPEDFNKEAFPTSGCMANASIWASMFGLLYTKLYASPERLCIIETDHYKPAGVPQHFCMWKDGMIIDPLDHNPQWKKNPYHVVSYRVFTPKKSLNEVIIDHVFTPEAAVAAAVAGAAEQNAVQPAPVAPVEPVAVPQPVQVTGSFPVDGSVPTEGTGTTQVDFSTLPNNYSAGSMSRPAVPWLDLIKKLFGLIFKK